MLEQGVHHHGTDWATIRRKFLPHRDEAQLRDTWENKLCEHARELTLNLTLTLTLTVTLTLTLTLTLTKVRTTAGRAAAASD